MKGRFKVQGSRFKVEAGCREPEVKSCLTRNAGPGAWIFQLTRPRLSAMVAFSALAGYFLHPAPAGRPALLFLGIFLLAGGCSALNQVQERDLDARMLRTRGRPLPSGSVQPGTALGLAAGWLAGGFAALVVADFLPVVLGLAAVLLYNGVYTPLKRRTAFAVLPGGLCGALPPMIGWTAAGGSATDFRAVLLAGLIFLWQVPHFWLFAEKNRNDYQLAELPLPGDSFSPPQVRRLVVVWTLALAATMTAFATFALVPLPHSRALTFLCTLLLLPFALEIRFRFETTPGNLFHRLTGGMGVILASIVLDRWISL